jgi:hypothetical protein
MINPLSLEGYARARQEEALRRAAHERLVREAKRAQPPRATPIQRLARRMVHWLGAQLVQSGYRLLPPATPESRGAAQPLPATSQAQPPRPRYVVTRAYCRPTTYRLPRRYSPVAG